MGLAPFVQQNLTSLVFHGQNLVRIHHCNPENSTSKMFILLFYVSWSLKEYTLIFSIILFYSKPNLKPFV